MHCQIGAPFFQRGFQFFDKQTFSAHFAQRPIQNLIALGRHAQEADLVALRLQKRLYVLSLPQG
jgi:hypothetical protein